MRDETWMPMGCVCEMGSESRDRTQVRTAAIQMWRAVRRYAQTYRTVLETALVEGGVVSRLLGTSYVPGRPGPAWACHPILERPVVRPVSPPRVARAPEPSQTGCSMIAYASLAGGPSINIETSRHRDIAGCGEKNFLPVLSMVCLFLPFPRGVWTVGQCSSRSALSPLPHGAQKQATAKNT